MNKKVFLFCSCAGIFCAFAAGAAEIDKNTARMQAMDKITGKVSVINVPVGGAVDFGSFSIVVRSCKTRPVEETPENFAFVDITDKTQKGDEVNVFKGWMISSSPATNAVEHPIYDVWLLKCLDTAVKPDQLLTEQQLVLRDSLPQQRITEKTTGNTTSPAGEEPAAPDTKLAKPMSEMIYQNNTGKDEETEKTEDTPQEQEFFYDEETEEQPDSSGTQNEIERIKSDILTNING